MLRVTVVEVQHVTTDLSVVSLLMTESVIQNPYISHQCASQI